MITTDLENLTNEIFEVANEFAPDIDMGLFTRFSDGKMYVTVEYNGNKDQYDYPLTECDRLIKKRLIKRYAKLSAYKTLSRSFGVDLPWGALTGIRPTKLAYQQGENWRSFFLDDMFVSPVKTQLISDILDSQKSIIRPDGTVNDLFISIPFCPTRCAYCSFLSCELGREKHVNEYIAALIKEIEHAKTLYSDFRCLYIGGGTPVSIEDGLFEKILISAAGDYEEFTVEAGRPDVITEDKLKLMKDYGVTRVCVNPQTFLDRTLAVIGRKHSAKDVIDKYELVKKYGFSVNMDLIAGLPGESFDDFRYSLDKAAELSPDNVTVHTLCLKKGSKLKESTQRLDVADVEAMVDYAHKTLAAAGYAPYYLYRQKYMAGNLENTGYAKPGTECVYNVDIMEEIANIVACGANGVSKRVFGDENRIERLAAPKDIKTYLDKVDEIIDNKNKLFS